MWVARHLGPDRFGELSYAISFAGLFGSLAYLGLDGLVTREIVKAHADDAESASILGTAAVMRFGGAVAGAVLATLAALAIGGPDGGRRAALVALISVGTLFNALDCIDFYYQARLQAKYTALARMVSLAAGACIRVLLIVARAPLWAFAAAVAVDSALRGTTLSLVYRRNGGRIRAWVFQRPRARALFAESWPLMLSAAAASVYLKIDQIMLGLMRDERAVGIYAAAARMSEIWYFIPAAIAASLLPAIVLMRSQDLPRYRRRVQRSFNLLLALGITVAVAVALVAQPAVRLLYGEEYAGAGRILLIHVFACPAVFVGNVLSKWLLAEGKTWFSLTRHGLGAVTNVVLNLLLIPRFGGMGAAIATVVAYTVANFLSTFVTAQTREAGRMISVAFVSLMTHPIRALRGTLPID